MKKIQFFNIPNVIEELTFDGDKKDRRLHYDGENFRWGASRKSDYQKAEKAIDKLGAKGEGWEIYAWYDVSGHHYWMKNMQETNYIQITVAFDRAQINESELPELQKALSIVAAQAKAITDKYAFDPYYS